MYYIYPYIYKHSILTESKKKQLYTAYVRSLLLYASTAWANASNADLNRIQIIENKALRIIANKKPQEITNNELYAYFNIKPILKQIGKNAIKFFTESKYKVEATECVGEYNRKTLPFNIRYKLVNQMLLDNDPNQ